LVEPRNGLLVRDKVYIEASVTSGCQLQSVIASIPGLSTDLTYLSQRFKATVPLNSVARGAFVLTVTATDVFGNSGSTSVTLTHDTLPTITIESPEVDALATLARPMLHVTARCQDDDPQGCVGFQLWVGGVLLATTTSTIDQDISLEQFRDGQENDLNFVATDSTYMLTLETTKVSRRVYVEKSPWLVESVRVPGFVLDDTATRTLFYDDSSQVCLYDKTTGQTTVLLGGTGHVTQYGYVTPTGAMFVSWPASGPSLNERIYEWRNNNLIDLGLPNSTQSLRVSGDYAIWSGSRSRTCCDASLYFEDLRTGSITTLEASAGNNGNDVAANGDVVYWTNDYHVVRYRNGVKSVLTEPLVNPPNPLLTDGINVVYHAGSTRLITPDGDVLLADPTAFGGSAVNSGWTAFTRQGLGNAANVWARSPAGVQTQLTFFGDRAEITALNDDGRVAIGYPAFDRDKGRTLIVQPGAAPVDVGANWNGGGFGFGPRNTWRSGTLYVPVGRSVLRLLTPRGAFTDDPLVPGVTVIRAAHIVELRSRIELVRARFGLGAYLYTDTTIAMPIPQLNTRSISSAAIPPVRASQPNTGGTDQ
jgi:hypothetical protein